MMFRNRYACPCGEEWFDEWSATCDDRCPRCDTSCSPVESEDVPEEEDGKEEWELCGSPHPPVRIPTTAYEGFSQVATTLLPPSAPKRTEAPVQAVSEAVHTLPSHQLDLFGGPHGNAD